MPTGLYGSDTKQNVIRVAVVELFGTMLLVAVGTAVAVSAALKSPIAGDPANSLSVALAFGLTLTALVFAFGHVSGAHFNPALTLALAITNKIGWVNAGVYIVAQCIGATLASLLVWYAYGDAGRNVARLGATIPAAGVDVWRVMALEAFFTFLLVLIVMAVATDNRAQKAASGTAAGFALVVAILAVGPLTGGAINPARALGPMIVSLNFEAVWGYVIGPIYGAIVAGVLYDKFFAPAQKPDSAE